MWDENRPDAPQPTAPESRRVVVDLDALDDGRCKASTYRTSRMPDRPTYENHFGPGGYNRCIGRVDHPNPTHKDEWGHVFSETGRILRIELPQTMIEKG